LVEEFEKLRGGNTEGVQISHIDNSAYDNLITRMRSSTLSREYSDLVEEFEKLRGGNTEGVQISHIDNSAYDNLITRMRSSTFYVRNIHAYSDIVEPLLFGMNLIHKSEMKFKQDEKWESLLYQRRTISVLKSLRQDGQDTGMSLLLQLNQFLRQPLWYTLNQAAVGMIKYTASSIWSFFFGRQKKAETVQEKIYKETKKQTDFMMTGQIDQTRGIFQEIKDSGVFGMAAKGAGSLLGIDRRTAQLRENQASLGQKKTGGLTGYLSSMLYTDIVRKGRKGGMIDYEKSAQKVEIINAKHLADLIAEAITGEKLGVVIEGDFTDKKESQEEKSLFSKMFSFLSFSKKDQVETNNSLLSKVEEQDFVFHNIESNTRKSHAFSKVSDTMSLNEQRRLRFLSETFFKNELETSDHVVLHLKEIKHEISKLRVGGKGKSSLGILESLAIFSVGAIGLFKTALFNFLSLLAKGSRVLLTKVLLPLGKWAFGNIAKYGKVAWDFVKSKSKEYWALAAAASSKFWNVTKEASAKSWDFIKSKSGQAWDATKNYSISAWNAVRETGKGYWDSLKSSIAQTGFIDKFKDLSDALKHGKDELAGFISKVPVLGTVMKIGTDFFKKAVEKYSNLELKEAFEDVSKTISETVTNVVAGATERFSSVSKEVSDGISGIASGVSNFAKMAWDSSTGFFSSFGKKVTEAVESVNTEKLTNTFTGALNGAITGAMVTKNPWGIAGGTIIGGYYGYTSNGESSGQGAMQPSAAMPNGAMRSNMIGRGKRGGVSIPMGGIANKNPPTEVRQFARIGSFVERNRELIKNSLKVVATVLGGIFGITKLVNFAWGSNELIEYAGSGKGADGSDRNVKNVTGDFVKSVLAGEYECALDKVDYNRVLARNVNIPQYLEDTSEFFQKNAKMVNDAYVVASANLEEAIKTQSEEEIKKYQMQIETLKIAYEQMKVVNDALQKTTDASERNAFVIEQVSKAITSTNAGDGTAHDLTTINIYGGAN
jgi:hypothetical protein